MTRALALCIGLALSAPAWATLWYVDGTGTGAGLTDGTSYANRYAGPTDAWLATGDIDTGDTLYWCGMAVGSSAVGDSGTSDVSRVTIDGACPRGDGSIDQGSINANGATGCLSSVQSRSYMTYQHLVFSNWVTTCLDLRTGVGIKVLDSVFTGVRTGLDTALIVGPSVTVMRVDIDHASAGIFTRGCTSCTFTDIDIVDGGVVGSAANLDGFGLDDSGGVGCEGTVVDGVRVLRQASSQGSGIDFQCSAGTGTITARNLFVADGEGVGITVGSLSTLTHDISNSVSINNAGADWYQKTTGTTATYDHIIGMQPARTTEAAFRFGDGSSTSMTATITNSVFVSSSQTLGLTNASGTLTDHHNFYVGPLFSTTNGVRTFAQWLTDAQCVQGGCDDEQPKFVGGLAPTTQDGFRLQGSSPLRGVGIPSTHKSDSRGCLYDPAAPALGVYEACARDPAAARTSIH